MEITKHDIIEGIKDDLIDDLINNFYEWLFEDCSDVCTMFTKKLVEGMLKTLNEGYLKEIKSELVSALADRLCEDKEYQIRREVVEKVSKNITKNIKISLEAKCTK